MKSMFKSQELWDLVENGYDELNPAPAVLNQQLRENRKRDAKALFFIQSTLDVSQLRTYGKDISNEVVVGKVLRTLNDFFKHVVPASEESKDLSTYTFNELMSYLLAHKARFKTSSTKAEEKAFQAKKESSFKGKSENFGDHTVRSLVTKRLSVGLSKKDEKQQVNVAENVEEESKLFMVEAPMQDTKDGLWYMDSGCLNQMSSTKAMFKELDESKKGEVRIGDNKLMRVDGKGTIGIKTISGNVKLLSDVQYVPNLAHNLLSVGQLLHSGYFVLFDNGCCSIYEKKSGRAYLVHKASSLGALFLSRKLYGSDGDVTRAHCARNGGCLRVKAVATTDSEQAVKVKATI
uniref:Retrovirus-related Pol polyprotein from transposon TNT 1-94-like beta-barrel domain-containing protein n=1 Tax=Chenopodium quinoa TaxID=63459 RepID=A0A803MMT5_CHEQI